jgi:RNA polymerase sigma factor (sigma-70 family)
MDNPVELDLSLNEIAGDSPDPEQYYARQEEGQRLEQAIDRLPAKLRGAVALRCYGDLSVQDLASRLGISVAAAKSRLLRGSKRLRCALGSTRPSKTVLAEPTYGPKT